MMILSFSHISFFLFIYKIIFDLFSHKDRNTIILYFFYILKSSFFILNNRTALLFVRLYNNQIFLRNNFKMLLRFENNKTCLIIFYTEYLASWILFFQTSLLYAFLFLLKLCLYIFVSFILL